jgi:deoxyribodipyrimidine photo-lyase
LTNGELNTPPGMASLDLPELSGERNPAYARGGEAEGQRLMREFFQRGGGIAQYGVTRNDMARDATSHLSPHLHFGTVSVRELARHAQKQASMTLKPSPLFAVRDPDGVRAWLGELIWREFYAQVLWHYPHAAYESFRPEYAELAWENDEEHFAAWCDGRTGYPIVDAAMRQLRVTGWMPNRARMITASFLTKDLLVDWRWGERHFRRHLIDADRASNNGGWQWAAGTGTDAQPFFRVFHPTEQGKRFDPAGEYVRRWVSELARVPNQYVHTPWQMPRPVMLEAGLEIGRDYPLPRVDHAEARERALKRYRMVQR